VYTTYRVEERTGTEERGEREMNTTIAELYRRAEELEGRRDRAEALDDLSRANDYAKARDRVYFEIARREEESEISG
jgi:hypothetical protein